MSQPGSSEPPTYLSRDNAWLLVANEFARVGVRVRPVATSSVLEVWDMKEGRLNRLDPLELESLAWASHHQLAGLVDPTSTRWPYLPRYRAYDAEHPDHEDGPSAIAGSRAQRLRRSGESHT